MPRNTKGVTGNGNRFKGNKNKKWKSFEVEIDTDEDYYAMVTEKTGSNRLRVLPVNNNEENTVSVIIPGRMIKKCWFNVGNVIVVTGNKENGDIIKGRVLSKLDNKIKNMFSHTKNDADKEIDDLFDFDRDFDKKQIEEENDKEEDFEGEIDFDIE
jgi:translation initiation factor IF-1